MTTAVKCYAYVDGDHARRYFNEAMSAFFGVEPPLNAGSIRAWARAERLFWYDSIDEQPRPNETPQQTAARVGAYKRGLDRVNSAEGCHVRLGLVKGDKTRRQKGVDVLLAVDMLTHAFRGSFERAVLIAGDLDFKPVVDALVGNGTFVQVGYFADHAANELLGAADSRREFTFDMLYQWCDPEFQKANPTPRSHIETPKSREETVLATGHAGELPARLVRLPDGKYEIVVERHYQGEQHLHVTHADRELLVKFFPLRFGELKLELSNA